MDEATDSELCLACLQSNARGAHFCRKCGAPLSSYATTAPLEHIYALGWMYRRALATPARPIVLVGIWLILGPTFLVSVIVLVLNALVWDVFAPEWPDGNFWLSTILFAVMAGTSGTILYRITRNFVVERMRYGEDGT